MSVVFLHGLESTVDEQLVPIGRKARYLQRRFDAALPALDTRVAQQVARREKDRCGSWVWPYEGYEEAFATPLARARAAIPPAPAAADCVAVSVLSFAMH